MFLQTLTKWHTRDGSRVLERSAFGGLHRKPHPPVGISNVYGSVSLWVVQWMMGEFVQLILVAG